MPVEVEWDNPEKTVVHYRFHGEWTWAEFYAAEAQLQSMINGMTYRIDFIIVLEAAPHLHLPYEWMRHMRQLDENRIAASGSMVVVGATAVIKMVIAMLRRLGNSIAQSAVFAETVEEARQYLQTLPR